MRPPWWAFAAVLLAPLCAPARALDTDQEAAVVEKIFSQPRNQAWARTAPPERVSAAKFQLMSWMEENPEQAKQLSVGLAIQSKSFDDTFQQYLKFYDDPRNAKSQLSDMARLSETLVQEKGFTESEAADMARSVFEGGGTEATLLYREAQAAVDAVEAAGAPEGARINARAYGDLRRSAEARLKTQSEALDRDRAAAVQAGVLAPLAPYLKDRQAAVAKAQDAFAQFNSVLAKRPAAVAGVRPDEAELLAHSRNELYRWLAASALSRDEDRFRRLLAELERPGAAEGLLAGLDVSTAAKAGYAAKAGALKLRLQKHLASCEATRKLLSDPAYAKNLGPLRLRAADDDREARSLQREIWRLLEPPQALRRAQRQSPAPGLWDRARTWFYANVLPQSPQAPSARRPSADEQILKDRIEKTAAGS